MGDKKVGRLSRTLLEAPRTRACIQTVRITLLFEFTALGCSKSLPRAFFVLTISGRFYIGTSQKKASCSTKAEFYNTNLFDFGK